MMTPEGIAEAIDRELQGRSSSPDVRLLMYAVQSQQEQINALTKLVEHLWKINCPELSVVSLRNK